MDTLLLPRFLVETKESHLLERFRLFHGLSSKFEDGVRHGKDPSVKILTKLANSTAVKNLEPLENLIQLLQKVAFDHHNQRKTEPHAAEVQQTKPHAEQNMTSDVEDRSDRTGNDNGKQKLPPPPMTCHPNKLHRFLDDWTRRDDIKEAYQNLDWSISAHKELTKEYIKKHRDVPAYSFKYPKLEYIRAKLEEEIDKDQGDVIDEAVLRENEEHLRIVNEIFSFNNSINLKAASPGTYKAYSKAQNHRKNHLLLYGRKMYQAAYDEVYDCIHGGVTSLLRGCHAAGLTGDVYDELQQIDCEKISDLIVEMISDKYIYPSLEDWHDEVNIPAPVRQCNNVKPDDTNKYCHLTGSRGNLLNDDNLSEFPQENVYVTVICKLKNQTPENLKLKKGQRIKQKFVSLDGQMAFGWTRTFKGGPKKYGFFPIAATNQAA